MSFCDGNNLSIRSFQFFSAISRIILPIIPGHILPPCSSQSQHLPYGPYPAIGQWYCRPGLPFCSQNNMLPLYPYTASISPSDWPESLFFYHPHFSLGEFFYTPFIDHILSPITPYAYPQNSYTGSNHTRPYHGPRFYGDAPYCLHEAGSPAGEAPTGPVP